MQARFDITADAATIHLEGRLTFAESGPFRHVVERLDGTACGRVVIDLTRLDYIDSAGMGLLLVARDRSAARGAGMRLANAHGQVERVLRLARFQDFFTLDGCCAQV